MDKITVFVDEVTGQEYVTIDHGNEQFISMLKSTYDEQQALTLNEPATKSK